VHARDHLPALLVLRNYVGHVIVDPEFYSKLKDPVEEEEDMLDLAFGLTETYNCLM
jgi:hypothetical protein